MSVGADRRHFWITEIQYLLLLAGECAWINPWVLSVESWLGGGRGPVVTFPTLTLLIVVAAVGTRLAMRTEGRQRLMRSVLVLLGIFGAGILALAQLTTLEGAVRSAEPWELWSDPVSGTRAIAGACLSLFLWWRGVTVGRSRPTQSNVEDEFRTSILAMAGLLLLLVAVGRPSAPPADSLALSAVVLVFSGLVGVPLARIVEEGEGARHRERTRLSPGGPWLAMLLGVVGAMLVVTLLLAQLFTFQRIGASLEPLRVPLTLAIESLVYTVALAMGLVVELLVFLARLIPRPEEAQTPVQATTMDWLRQFRQQARPEPLVPELLVALKVVPALGVALVVVWILVRAIFGLRDRGDQDDIEEIRDMVWSWPGRKALRRWLRARLPSTGAGAQPPSLSRGDGVRELYRQFLGLGAAVGWVRRVAETPLEYELRLKNDGGLAGQEDVRSITESYIRVRYAAPARKPPDPQSVASALARLRAVWQDRIPDSQQQP